ncbi:hypothetical protein ACOZ38_37830 [Sphaerisporangium viridialbum]|uniref:hypothetical protein n=1 Tax=Sphaerisporangium viridialbum TaxID=46189 RepID=UPI003C72DC7B
MTVWAIWTAAWRAMCFVVVGEVGGGALVFGSGVQEGERQGGVVVFDEAGADGEYVLDRVLKLVDVGGSGHGRLP